MDVLDEIYQALKADPFISEQVQGRFKFYEYPATGDLSGPVVVMEEAGPPLPGDFADNKWLTEDYFVHVEVWVQGAGGRTKRDAIAKRIQNVIWEKFGFPLVSGMKPEWDKETNTYRDARRYRGKVYVN
ncbi:hypothetical protein [Mesobacillus jeotgali]|uniref:hypothetical protein n=1 Tax=Mesobacillus jeotgali TaxID=129985 RepID=UPI001CFD43A2|nr:hypothetical protein [Mesobacillus jeotgali]